MLTTIEDSTRFLYTGANPIQREVDAGTFEARRLAVIRGQVSARGGSPLPDVRVSVLGHPEFGYTFTRADGLFDLVINGGGTVTLNYQRADLLPAQRTLVATPWRDYVWAPAVVMIGKDPVATAIDLASISGVAVARSSPSTDASGTRQATLFFSQGTTASRVKADGTTEPLSTVTVRATEYTVGADGPKSMPAELPSTSAYTYAVELSVDELGPDEEVRFSQPVAVYVENFLGFPVGGIVPAGFYDRKRAAWIASDNGRVISILSKTGGLADLDLAGQGTAATAAELTALGIGDAERASLATLYSVGTSLWRTPTTHFTPWDYNWPYGPPADAQPPPPTPEPPPEKDECEQKGSIIGCQAQVLGEAFPIEGTGYQLRYSSRWSAAPQVPVVISGSSVSSTMKRIEVELIYAGRRIFETFDPAPNLTKAYRLEPTDAYGRTLSGPVPVRVSISYVYQALYLQPAEQARSFAAASQASQSGSVGLSRDMGRMEIRQTRVLEPKVRFQADNVASLGGLRLDVHHAITSDGTLLSMGDGTERSLEPVLETYAGNGSRSGGDGQVATAAGFNVVTGAAVGPDGSMYVADNWSALVRRIDGATQKVSTFAGSVEQAGGTYGDNGPAVQAGLEGPYAVTVAPDGSVYIADRYRVRRVDPSGIITTAAGGGTVKVLNSPVPATEARFGYLMGIVAAPDGTVFISDFGDSRIYRLDRDGMLTRIAGSTYGFSGDNGPAINAQLGSPWHLALDKDGALFVADNGNNRIRRIGPDGVIRTVAGNGTWASQGDGAAAVDGALDGPNGVAVRPDGSLLISENNRIREVTKDGILRTYAGNGLSGTPAEGAPATSQKLGGPQFVTISPQGVVSFGDGYYFVRQVKHTRLRRNAADEMLSPVGNEVSVFDPNGRHLRTLDATSGRDILTFGYDSRGYLSSVTDADGRVMTISRDLAGNPTALTAPNGLVTTLALDASGRVSVVTNPDASKHQLTYNAEGLLQTYVDRAGAEHRFSYDEAGRLTRDEGPSGFVKTLTRTELPNGTSVTLSTGLGSTTEYRSTYLPAGDIQREVIYPGGARSVTVIKSDGTSVSTTPDGTVMTQVMGPDPVWGMAMPREVALSTRRPGAPDAGVTTTYAATLVDPNDPSTLASYAVQHQREGITSLSSYQAGDGGTLNYTFPNQRRGTLLFDERHRLRESRLEGGATTTFAYDSRGNTTSMAQSFGTVTRTWQKSYDSLDRLTSVTLPDGRAFAYEYDSVHRVSQKTVPGGGRIMFTYDAAGRLSSITPPGRGATSFAYDSAGNVASRIEPVVSGTTGVTSYTRDIDGKLKSVTTADGRTVTTTSDDVAHTSTISFDRGDIVATLNATTGLAATIRAPGDELLSLAYEGALLKQETWSGTIQGSVTRVFDAFGRVTEVNAGGQSIPHTYDTGGQLQTVGTLSITRDATTRDVTATALGVVSTARTPDSLDAVTAHSASVSGTPVFAESFVYDTTGRLAGRVESISGVSHSYAYTYDEAGHLTSVSKDGTAIESYGFDVNGNRVSQGLGGGVLTATFDAQDRIQSLGSAVTVEHDGRGDVTAIHEGTSTTRFTFDGLGALTSATLADGRVISYVFDGRARRIGKRVDGTLVQRFLYDGQLRPVVELDGSGAVVSVFVYAQHPSLPEYMIRGGVRYRIISDGRGSPRLVVNAEDGSIAQRLDFDSFGQLVEDTNPGFQPFGFQGGLYDADTGLVHLGAREYLPSFGRFLTKDPLGLAGGTNLYLFAAGDPVNRGDPFGLAPFNLHNFITNHSDAIIARGIQLGNKAAQNPSYSPAQDFFNQVREARDAADRALQNGCITKEAYLAEQTVLAALDRYGFVYGLTQELGADWGILGELIGLSIGSLVNAAETIVKAINSDHGRSPATLDNITFGTYGALDAMFGNGVFIH